MLRGCAPLVYLNRGCDPGAGKQINLINKQVHVKYLDALSRVHLFRSNLMVEGGQVYHKAFRLWNKSFTLCWWVKNKKEAALCAKQPPGEKQ